jgi:hypothetical protein
MRPFGVLPPPTRRKILEEAGPDERRSITPLLVHSSYNETVASDEYHEAVLERVHEMQREILSLSPREAQSYAYLMSRDIPEEAARMLVAEMLLDYWSRNRSPTLLLGG